MMERFIPGRYQLRVLAGADAGTTVPLESEVATVGRVAGNALTLRDPFVAHRHVRLSWDEARDCYVAEDLNGVNSLMLNGARCEMPAKYRLEDGDRLGVGGVEIAFELRENAAERRGEFDLVNRRLPDRRPAPPARPAPPPPPPARAADPPRVPEPDGRTMETAFVVDSVPEEYRILQRLGLRLVQQSLRPAGEKAYDVMTCIDPEGSTLEIWFDISRFFGKPRP